MSIVSKPVIVLGKKVTDKLPPGTKINVYGPDGKFWYSAEPFRDEPKK